MHLPAAVALAVVIFLLLFLRNRGRKPGAAPLSSSSPAGERWMKERVLHALADRLGKKGIDREHVASTLGGDPDGAVVSAIEQAIKAIELEYVRDPQASDLEVRARIRFQDGGEEDIKTRIAYTEAPASVRDDFERKATTRAFRKWDFPWITAS